jgi:glyoxylase-like metal-dependent hydrolase (beta-lactamase superfamily II)
MAPRRRQETGAPIVLHELEAKAVSELADFRDVDPGAWGVPSDRWDEVRALRHARSAYRLVTPDVVVRGPVDRLNHPGLELEALHTPGHTIGHICLRLPAEKLLLTGDHVLPAIYPGLGLGGRPTVNPIAAYLESLERVAVFDDHEILPGHHYRFTGLAERVERTAAHHRRRSDEVAVALAADPEATVYRVAAALTWSGGWERMQGFLLYSALTQTAMHIDLLRSRSA